MRILLILSFLSGLVIAADCDIEAIWVGQEALGEEFPALFAEDREAVEASAEFAEQSRFFTAGDSVRDLGECFAKDGIDLAGGWIYLNESTGYLVAKAPARTLGLLEFRYRLASDSAIPVNLKLTLEVFSVACAGEEVVDWAAVWEHCEKEPLFATSTLSRSGETFTQKLGGEDAPRVGLECSLFLGEEKQVVEARLSFSWGGEALKYRLQTGLTLREGEAFFLEMGTLAEGRTHLLRLRPEALIVGGPTWSARHLRESGEMPAPALIPTWRRSEELPPIDGQQVRALTLFPNEIDELFGNSNPSGEDPFAVSEDSGEEPFRLGDLPAVQEVPPLLAQLWPRENWVDAGKLLGDCGLDLGEGDFVYYGLVGENLILSSADEVNFDLMEQIFSLLCGGHSPETTISHWRLVREREGRREVVGRASLAARAGESGQLSLSAGEDCLEVEARQTFGRSGLADLQFAFESQGQLSAELRSSFTCRVKNPQEILLRKGDGESLFLWAEVEEEPLFEPSKY